jgi:hypothetical protein
MLQELVKILLCAVLRVTWIMSFAYSILLFSYGAWAYGVSHDILLVNKMIFSVCLFAINIFLFVKFKSFFLNKGNGDSNCEKSERNLDKTIRD